MIGRTISHYEIVEKLGEGGMGVVYKARDTHLDRFVAIKVLPPEKVAEPERKRRFVQEAKAASALNHPNIITIHDIASEGGRDFMVMEYVAGKTLDRLLGRKGLSVAQCLKYAVQIADALSKAHGAGIVHRDLKPSNVMVTDDGLAKVLDFGLAKLSEPATGELAPTQTLKPHTEEGAIVGTVAYMSPEQAQGKQIDARSDIFSFGSVLYEMVTGRRAFEADSNMATLGAIIHTEPQPLGSKVPHDLEKVITRCLRRDPDRRFQHMVDVKIALEELKEESDSGTLETEKPVNPKPRRRLLWSAAVVAAVVALTMAGIWILRSRARTPEEPLTAVPLTSYPGREDSPSFSPDGTQVAFRWCPQDPGKNCQIYVKQIGVEPPFQLTDNPAPSDSPAWSPDGRTIAFRRRLSLTRVALILIPQRGGRERMLEELDESARGRGDVTEPCLAWTPNSKWLVSPVFEEGTPPRAALFMFSVETGEKRRLTPPRLTAAGIGAVDTAPAFSPDGRTMVFSREGGTRSDLYLLRFAENYVPQGEPELIASDNLWNVYAAWTPDGSEIVFSSGTENNQGLWRIAASRPVRPRRLAFAWDQASMPAVSRQANRLAYAVGGSTANIWRVDLGGAGRKPGIPVKFISSTRWESCPAYSPDGKRIAFVSTRSGAQEIWVCESDGSSALQLTSFGGSLIQGPQWAPGGESIAFQAEPGGNADIYVISANGGAPRRLTTDPRQDKWPNWSRDGKWLYFSVAPVNQIWKMPSSGGEAVPITRNDGDMPHESPDGKWLYYEKGWPSRCSVWRIPVDGGEETKVLDSVHPYGQWAVGKEGIYFFTVPDEQRHSDIRLYEFTTGKTRKILTIERPVGSYIAVSPDGLTLLYSQFDEGDSDLMLVENFR